MICRKNEMKVTACIMFILCILGCRNNYQSNDYIWSCTFTSDGYEKIQKREKVDLVSDDIKELIFHLNGSNLDPITYSNELSTENNYFNGPKIQFISLKNSTVTVRIINNEHLTQRMGSSGASEYLAKVTFTLTENNLIDRVEFIFVEGDHARPGVYSRADFDNYLIIQE
jgi:hypothetical protein